MTASLRTTGNVTFLFSDIEGSTALERRVGTARYAEIRERQRALLRAAWDANGGEEQGTEGDSFFVVFERATSAVTAAVAAQRALAAEPWPEDVAVAVRMGLHTGEAERVGGSLIGLDVNKAARIAAVAHGGQIVVSNQTASLLADRLPADIRLRDLGTYRLKDLLDPEPLVAVLGDGLRSEFPPLRTPDAHPNNLPTQLTTFVGRDAELDEITGLLAMTRLLTLTGPGGTGKTRLSIQLAVRVADDFPDGVFFVPLEPVRDPMLLAARIAGAIGLVEGPSRPIADSVAEWLADRRVLLILDNFEQVVAAAPVVTDLLRGAAHVKVIVTSRSPLHVSGEQEYPVPGLPVPPDPGRRSGADRFNRPAEVSIDPRTLDQYAAVRLFIERAVAVRPGFAVTNENAPAVAAISARLQGMPLAIELAAARIKLLSPDAILTRLEHQLDLLASGARDVPARQQTLRGAIAWSYDLLDDSARRLLDRLSVFAGGCDLAAAEAVCGPASEVGGDLIDGMMALVDQSLIKIDEARTDGEPRFHLLDTIREFAAEHLVERGETALIRDRHRDWYVALAETAANELSGTAQRTWLDRLELEHDDIRVVLDRAVEAPDPSVAIGLAFSMWRFWQKHGHLAEARRRLDAMAAAPWSHDDPRLRGRLMEALGGTCWWQGELEPMGRCYDEALKLWESIGDEREIANAAYNASFRYSVLRAVPGATTDDDGVGLALLERSRALYHSLGDLRGEANTLWGIGNFHYFQGSPGHGVAYFRQALEMFRSVGDRTMEAWALHMLGTGLLRNGDVAEAREPIVHAIRHFRDAGDAAGLTLTFDDLSAVAVAEGDLPRAARLRGAARSLTHETGAELASVVEDQFETGVRPGVRSQLPAADLERYGAEGAAMTLDEAIAYALGDDPGGAEPDTRAT